MMIDNRMTKKPEIIDARTKGDRQFANLTLELLENHQLAPHPKNYTVGFSYVKRNHKALAKDFDALVEAKKLNEKTMNDLYHRYNVVEPDSRNEEVSNTIEQLVKLVGEFSNHTENYNQQLDKQTISLSETIKSKADLGALLTDVVNQLKNVRKSGGDFNQKIKASQLEIIELKRNLDKATSEARLDELTGLSNRRAFDEVMKLETGNAKADNKDLCLLLLDIDHFKTFNDTWGHLIGDEVLKVVSGALKRTVRGQDFVARFGGEEFAILLPDTPTNGAHIVAENIRKLIANNRLRRKNSTEELSQITISIGVTRFRDGDNDESIEKFIKRADDALYSAKQNGRNRVNIEL